jgi:hypothetical protein
LQGRARMPILPRNKVKFFLKKPEQNQGGYQFAPQFRSQQGL